MPPSLIVDCRANRLTLRFEIVGDLGSRVERLRRSRLPEAAARERTNNNAAGSRDGGFPQRLGRENMLTRLPSGSRSKSERLPHGIDVVGITMFAPYAFIRSNTASTSSTSNSRIAD